jgi:TPR repeat protein
MAWAVRGANYISDTPASQIEAMKNYLTRARPDLSASLTLTDKPYLSALYLLNFAMLDGTAAERRQWFERGTSIDPDNSMVRLRYMFSLRPRWGGSYREMQEFLEQCERQNVPPKLHARLDMLIHADLAEDAARSADNQKIFDEWQQVLNLAAAAGEEPSTEALIGFTRAAQDLNRSAAAERGLKLLENRSPNDAWSQGRLGWIYIQAHRDDKAWTFLTRAAEQNDPWAQFLIGHSTYDGVPTLRKAPDQQAGLVWIRRSAEQCFPDAMRFLAARGEKPSADCKRRASANREWWTVLIPAVGLIPGLLAALAAANRKRTGAAVEHAGRLQQPPSTLALGVLLLGLALALAILSMFHDNDTAAPIFNGVLGLLGVLAMSMIVAYYRAWYELTAAGLDFGRFLGRRGSIKWRDITCITYSRAMRWFRIETASGEVVRISAMLTGLPEFARAVLEQVPSYAIDGTTREALHAFVQGELPGLAG